MNLLVRAHGGPDARDAPLYDFSTNSNAYGPCPHALAAVQQADATRYPDPTYTALCAHLADCCAVDGARIVLAGSASEFIFRITAWARQQGARTVSLPMHGYGDYAYAAQAWGLQAAASPDDADAVWACEPSSPLGQNHSLWPAWLVQGDAIAASTGQFVVLDCAYEPLRFSGTPSLSDAQRKRVWQLFSPNKALGLTGVRAAFAIAPVDAEAAASALELRAPSWVLGSHGVAMLHAWTGAAAQAWLRERLDTLRNWKTHQMALLQNLDWTVLPSDAPFFCASPPGCLSVPALCDTVRAQGIKLRDTAFFGLPGTVRLGVLSPPAQQALADALRSMPSQPRFKSTCY